MNLQAFEKRWLQHFAAEVSKESIEKYVVSTGNYIWHVFSWNLLPQERYLTGEAAQKAYDQADKTGAVYIKPFGGTGSHALPKALMRASALDALIEVYVAAKDFSWTYIKTHENDMCGPYFMECPAKSQNK